MTIMTKPLPDAVLDQHVANLAQAYASKIVRRDNKFYDVNYLGTPLSRNDVETIILNRIHVDFPEIPLSSPLIKKLFRLLIEIHHTDTSRSIQVWNGSTTCEPGNTNRLIMMNGSVSANAWSQPEYRRLKINSSEFGVISEFFKAFFQRDEDHEQFLNWFPA